MADFRQRDRKIETQNHGNTETEKHRESQRERDRNTETTKKQNKNKRNKQNTEKVIQYNIRKGNDILTTLAEIKQNVNPLLEAKTRRDKIHTFVELNIPSVTRVFI